MTDQTPVTGFDFSRLRIDYKQKSLDLADVADNPILQFSLWLNEAIRAGANEPNAMTLATSTRDGLPSARIVLLKGVDERGLTFFTNYTSRKGLDLEANPKAAAVFYWPELERQVRIEGSATRTSVEESSAYFNSRPPDARFGSAASPQSQPIESREVLENTEALLHKQFPDGRIPCPPHWGGYRLQPSRVEFWQGRPSRLHDRIEFLREGESHWQRRRLAP